MLEIWRSQSEHLSGVNLPTFTRVWKISDIAGDGQMPGCLHGDIRTEGWLEDQAMTLVRWGVDLTK